MAGEPTLDDGWEAACLAFYHAAGIDLKTQKPPTADGIRVDYEKKKAQTREDRRKLDKIQDAFNKTMTFIDRVGGIAAEGASMAFGSPASIAGSALSFFIAAGVAYRQIFQDIEDLLGQVLIVFERFQVYRDDEGILPPQMIRVANKLLVTLVQVCGLCLQTLKKSRLKTFLSMTLFGDDSGVRAQLAKLQSIQAEEGQMRGTLTLVATEKTRRSVETGFAQTTTQFRTLETSMQTMQIRLQVREDLKYLSQALNIQQKDPSVEEYRNKVAELSDESCQWLLNDHTYQSWSDDQGNTDLAAIIGEESVGKTFTITAILQDLKRRYPADQESPHKVCIAQYYITQSDRQEKLPHLSDVIQGLAWQAAQTNLPFRSRLVDACKRCAGNFENTSDMWKRLIMDCAGGSSTIFLVIDGIQNLGTESQNQLRNLIRTFAPTSRSTGIKILLAAREKFAQQLTFSLPTLVTMDLKYKSRQDMERHVSTKVGQMKIFHKQGGGTDDLRKAVIDGLSKGVQGNFMYVDILLGEIARAYDSQQVRAIVERVERGFVLSDSIRAIIEKYNKILSVRELEDLNLVILWVLYATDRVSPELLEAVIYLRHGESPLKSICDQITEQFADLFSVDSQGYADELGLSTISFKSGMIEEYFTGMNHDVLQSSSGKATIREINMLRNLVEKFCDEDLYEELGLATFFENKISKATTAVMIDSENATAFISIQCLQALLDSRSGLEHLRSYANANLLNHLRGLGASRGRSRAEGDVGPLLVRYLTDTSYITFGNLSPFCPCLSFADDLMEEIIRLLRNPMVIRNVISKSSDDRRWVLSIQESATAEVDVLLPLAKFMSKALDTVRINELLSDKTMPYYIDAFRWLFGLMNKRQHIEDPVRFPRIKGLHEDMMTAHKSSRSMHEMSIDTIHDVFAFAHGLLDEESPVLNHTFRLAQIYSACGHRAASLAKLQECLSTYPDNIKIMAELANTHAPDSVSVEHDDYEMAIQYMARVMEKEEVSGVAGNPDSYSSFNRDAMLKWQLKTCRYEEIERFYTRKLKELAGNCPYTIRLLLLKHRRGHHAEVVKLLEEYWCQHKTAKLCELLLGIAYGWDFDYECDPFRAIAHSFSQQHKLIDLQNMCAEVLRSAVRRENQAKWSFFLSYDRLKTYLGQTYFENPKMSEDIDRAVQLWEEVVTQNRSPNFHENPAYCSVKFLVPIYLECAMQAGKDTPTATAMLDKIKVLEAAAVTEDATGKVSNAMFTASICHYHISNGDTRAAKSIIEPEVDAGIRLLLDDDPENDWQGFRRLGHAFVHFADDENAMAAWRHIGPTTGLEFHRKVMTAQREGENGAQNSKLIAENAATPATTTGAGEHQLSEDPESRLPSFEQVKGPLEWFHCRGECGKAWTFSDNFWICRACAHVVLDSKCFTKFQAGSWKPLGCSFQHEYFHVPPWDLACTERFESKMTRVGERTIPLAQWLVEICAAWGIKH